MSNVIDFYKAAEDLNDKEIENLRACVNDYVESRDLYVRSQQARGLSFLQANQAFEKRIRSAYLADGKEVPASLEIVLGKHGLTKEIAFNFVMGQLKREAAQLAEESK